MKTHSDGSELGGDRRLFVVGTGKQHRQETLLHLAEYGRGAATFAGDSDSLETAAVATA